MERDLREEFVTPADQKHHDMLNHLCITLLEQLGVWGWAARLCPGLAPLQSKDHLQLLSI